MRKTGLESVLVTSLMAVATSSCGKAHAGAGGSTTSSSSSASSSTSMATTATGSSSASTSTGGVTAGNVFVTSATFAGDFGNVAAMAAKCQAAAQAAGLPGTWDAWASDSTSSPSMRFTHSTKPYVLVGGPEIATSWTDLTDGQLEAPIDHDEHGMLITVADPYVWTATNADGTGGSPACCAWTATCGSFYGSPLATGSQWTFAGGAVCMGVMRRLYCFQQ